MEGKARTLTISALMQVLLHSPCTMLIDYLFVVPLFSSDPALILQSVVFSVSTKVFFSNTVLRLVVST